MKQVLFVMLVLMAAPVCATTIITLGTPADGAWTSSPSFNFTAVSDINASFSCELLIDSTGYGINGSVANATATTIVPNTTLQGTSAWQVNCTDANGTVASAQRTINVDSVAPSPVISSPTDGAELDDELTIEFTITDALDASIAYVLYINDVINLSGSATNATMEDISLVLADGSYELVVEGTDEAGNSANSSAVSVEVDTTEPVEERGRHKLPVLGNREFEVRLNPSGGRYAFFLDRQVHYVRATGIDGDTVTLLFAAEPVEMMLRLGESRNLDITGDGVVDVYVLVKDLTTRTAYVAFGLPQSIAGPEETPEPAQREEMLAVPSTTPETVAKTENLLTGNAVAQSGSARSGFAWIVGALAIVVVGLLVWRKWYAAA